MEAKSEALARQFERRVQDALATLARLSDADWAKVTEAEQWSVGVTAHHIAGVLEPISQMVTPRWWPGTRPPPRSAWTRWTR
jgi:hypothetical protein